MERSFDTAVVPCADYGEGVGAALTSALDAIGGLDFVKAGMTVAIKANLVTAAKPDTATTVHPRVLEELCRLLTDRGARVIIGDSPGGLYNEAILSHVYKVAGLTPLEREGVTLNRNFGEKDTAYPEGKVLHSFRYTAYLDEADVIVNVAKLKCHGMMGMSAAAKNMFGTVPGTLKPEYHFRFPDHADFANMILDLDEYFKPVLHLVDAVVGMEGNGPTGGDPRQIGALVASHSPHQADLVCARLIGLSPEEVVEILNEYLSLTTRAIFKNKGTLDKFIGDATMAIFNAPFDLDDYVFRAVMTAMDIAKGSDELEKRLMERFGRSISFGIGVNCGEAVVGNIGCEHRMDFTAIGDTVNTAARLESNAARGQILISREVYERVKDRVDAEEIGVIPLKGKSQEVFVYQLNKIMTLEENR